MMNDLPTSIGRFADAGFILKLTSHASLGHISKCISICMTPLKDKRASFNVAKMNVPNGQEKDFF